MSYINSWWVWQYPSIWVPIFCALLSVLGQFIRLMADSRLRKYGHLIQLQEVYDACNTIAGGPNVQRAAVFLTCNTNFLSHRTKAHVTMLSESSSVGTQRTNWEEHCVNEAYINDLIVLVKSGKHFFDAETTDPALRALWQSEGTIGALVYLLRVEYTSMWRWCFGGYAIVSLTYLSANLRQEATDADLKAIENGVARLKKLYK